MDFLFHRFSQLGNKKSVYQGFDKRFAILRGRDQIRTDVQGFADLCLTTRPPDLLSFTFLKTRKAIKKFINLKKKLRLNYN